MHTVKTYSSQQLNATCTKRNISVTIVTMFMHLVFSFDLAAAAFSDAFDPGTFTWGPPPSPTAGTFETLSSLLSFMNSSSLSLFFG